MIPSTSKNSASNILIVENIIMMIVNNFFTAFAFSNPSSDPLATSTIVADDTNRSHESAFWDARLHRVCINIHTYIHTQLHAYIHTYTISYTRTNMHSHIEVHRST